MDTAGLLMNKKSSFIIDKNTTMNLKEVYGEISIVVKEGVSLQIYQMLLENYQANINIELLKGANLNFVSLVLPNENVKINEVLKVYLNQEDSSFCYYLASLADFKQDFDVQVVHNAGKTNSKQISKIVAVDNANFNLSSKIKVSQNAQKVDAMQNSKGLMLSDNAQINVNPALEIYADDVKCSHGNAIGFADEEQIFYLTSRGVTKEKAYKMLAKAFFADIINNVNQEDVKNDFLIALERKISKIDVSY